MGGAPFVRKSEGGSTMAYYVSLMKLTEQGLKDIKNAPARLAEAEQGLEAVGAKLVAFYMLMGEYDYIGITEGSSDEVAMTFLLNLGLQGNVRTITMKAFSREQLAGFIKNLP